MYDVNEIKITVSVVKAKPEIVWGDKEAAWDSGKAIMPAYSDSAEYKRPSLLGSNDLDEHGSGIPPP